MAVKYTVSFQDFKGLIGSADLKASLEAVGAKVALDAVSLQMLVEVDPDTLNRYIRGDSVTMAEILSYDLSTAASDTATVSDAPSLDFSRVISGDDQVSFTDALVRTVNYVRSFSDAFTLDDAANVDSFVKDTQTTKTNIVGMLEQAALLLSKAFSDSVSTSDAINSKDYGLDKSESISVTEAVGLDFSQGVGHETDSVAPTDAPQLQPLLSKQDGVSVTEAVGLAISQGVGHETDSATLSESHAYLLNREFTDSSTLSESLARVVTYNRSFTDSFTLDDFTDVDALTKQTGANKTNVFSVLEEHAKSLSKELADSFDVSELAAISVARPASDSFSVSESLSINLVSGASSVLNSSPINGFTLNQ
jgi:hypothetical protein